MIRLKIGNKIDFTNFLSKAKNPGIVFFTLFFKALAIVSFLFLGIFGISEALMSFLALFYNKVLALFRTYLYLSKSYIEHYIDISFYILVIIIKIKSNKNLILIKI